MKHPGPKTLRPILQNQIRNLQVKDMDNTVPIGCSIGQEKYCRAKPGQVLFGAGTKELELLGTASAGRGVKEAQLAVLLLLHPVSQNLALLFI